MADPFQASAVVNDLSGAGTLAEGAATGNPISLIAGAAQLASGLFGSSPASSSAPLQGYASGGSGGGEVVAPSVTSEGSFFGIPLGQNVQAGLAVAAPATLLQPATLSQPNIPQIATTQPMAMAPLSALPSPTSSNFGAPGAGGSGAITNFRSQPQIVSQLPLGATNPPLQGYVSNSPTTPQQAITQQPSDLDSPQAVAARYQAAAAAEPPLNPIQVQAQQMASNAAQFMQPFFNQFGNLAAQPAQAKSPNGLVPPPPPYTPSYQVPQAGIKPGVSPVGGNPGQVQQPQLQAQQPQFQDVMTDVYGMLLPTQNAMSDQIKAADAFMKQLGSNLGKVPIQDTSSIQALTDQYDTRHQILNFQLKQQAKSVMKPFDDARKSTFEDKTYTSPTGEKISLNDYQHGLQQAVISANGKIAQLLEPKNGLSAQQQQEIADNLIQNGHSMTPQALMEQVQRLGADPRAVAYEEKIRSDMEGAHKLLAGPQTQPSSISQLFQKGGGGLLGAIRGAGAISGAIQEAILNPGAERVRQWNNTERQNLADAIFDPTHREALVKAYAQAQLKENDYNQARRLEGERNTYNAQIKEIEDRKTVLNNARIAAGNQMLEVAKNSLGALDSNFAAQLHALATQNNLTARLAEAANAQNQWRSQQAFQAAQLTATGTQAAAQIALNIQKSQLENAKAGAEVEKSIGDARLKGLAAIGTVNDKLNAGMKALQDPKSHLSPEEVRKKEHDLIEAYKTAVGIIQNATADEIQKMGPNLADMTQQRKVLDEQMKQTKNFQKQFATTVSNPK